MNLESPKTSLDKSAAYIFNALSDIKNFEKLMPENIAKFEVIDENCFEFGLKGMPEIKLVKKASTPNSEIILGAASSKLPFTLTAKIDAISENATDVQLFFEGEFNAMMAMMVKGPITKFIETLASNMNKL
ncbi:MAG: orotate phosphoribosyltransferase [Flavobacteriales bacterium]|nr:MAG: orotate phosphoribosyltransferase [Flavobacteriales bacterium]